MLCFWIFVVGIEFDGDEVGTGDGLDLHQSKVKLASKSKGGLCFLVIRVNHNVAGDGPPLGFSRGVAELGGSHQYFGPVQKGGCDGVGQLGSVRNTNEKEKMLLRALGISRSCTSALRTLA